MRALAFAVRSLVRQPARARWASWAWPRWARCSSTCCCCRAGWCVSFREMLDEAGFDVRVLATDTPLLYGPRIGDAAAAAAAIAALPEVEDVVPLRFGEALAAGPDGKDVEVYLLRRGPGPPRTLDARWRAATSPGAEPASLVVNREPRPPVRRRARRAGDAARGLLTGAAGPAPGDVPRRRASRTFPFDETARA